jgi:hypothetical protein
MRGDEQVQDEIFSCLTLEQRVPQDHPLRAIRKLTDGVLRSLSDDFDALYSASGRPSIAPEYTLRALLLQVFYSVRSERQLVEQLDYNRNGLITAAMATEADGHAERDAALLMLDERQKTSTKRITVGPLMRTTQRASSPELAPLTSPHMFRRMERDAARTWTQEPSGTLADREDLRLAEADRPTRPGKVARTRQGRLGLGLQLVGSQSRSSWFVFVGIASTGSPTEIWPR